VVVWGEARRTPSQRVGRHARGSIRAQKNSRDRRRIAAPVSGIAVVRARTRAGRPVAGARSEARPKRRREDDRREREGGPVHDAHIAHGSRRHRRFDVGVADLCGIIGTKTGRVVGASDHFGRTPRTRAVDGQQRVRAGVRALVVVSAVRRDDQHAVRRRHEPEHGVGYRAGIARRASVGTCASHEQQLLADLEPRRIRAAVGATRRSRERHDRASSLAPEVNHMDPVLVTGGGGPARAR